jgi:phospholipid/cholesterol/gamma-HCH transport system substrate-binding protein
MVEPGYECGVPLGYDQRSCDMATDSKYNRVETLVGLIVVAGILLLGYIATGWINRNLLRANGYVVYADFASAVGLHVGDPVEIAGVKVGTVESLSLADYQARLALRINETIRIHEDATASIIRDWFIGARRISIHSGESAKTLAPGDEIKRTESPPSIQQLAGELLVGDLTSNQ